jgi:hypothetical protein
VNDGIKLASRGQGGDADGGTSLAITLQLKAQDIIKCYAELDYAAGTLKQAYDDVDITTYLTRL